MGHEEKTTFHPGRKQRPNHGPFAVEKNSSHNKPLLQVIFRFSWEIFTLSGSRCIFRQFCRFPSQNIVEKKEISSALVDAMYQIFSD